jgi:hypothetical protein
LKITIGPWLDLPISLNMDNTHAIHSSPEVDLLHAIGSRMAAADPFHEVLYPGYRLRGFAGEMRFVLRLRAGWAGFDPAGARKIRTPSRSTS